MLGKIKENFLGLKTHNERGSKHFNKKNKVWTFSGSKEPQGGGDMGKGNMVLEGEGTWGYGMEGTLA